MVGEGLSHWIQVYLPYKMKRNVGKSTIHGSYMFDNYISYDYGDVAYPDV